MQICKAMPMDADPWCKRQPPQPRSSMYHLNYPSSLWFYIFLSCFTVPWSCCIYILTLLQGLEMARRVSFLCLLPILTSPTIGSLGQPAFFSPLEPPCYSCIEILLEFIHEKNRWRWNHAKGRKTKNAQDSHDDTDRKMLKKLDILSDHPVGNTIHPNRYKADVTALHFFSVNLLSSFLTLIPPENSPHHTFIPHPNPPSLHSLITFVLSDINWIYHLQVSKSHTMAATRTEFVSHLASLGHHNSPPPTDQNQNSFPNIRACLFDMDGLLIDSEDIYTFCNNIILHQYGKPSLPWSVKAQLQGRPGPEVLLLLFKPFITK